MRGMGMSGTHEGQPVDEATEARVVAEVLEHLLGSGDALAEFESLGEGGGCEEGVLCAGCGWGEIGEGVG